MARFFCLCELIYFSSVIQRGFDKYILLVWKCYRCLLRVLYTYSYFNIMCSCSWYLVLLLFGAM